MYTTNTHLKVGQVIETDVVICDEDRFSGVADSRHQDGPLGRLNCLFHGRRLPRARPVEVDEYPVPTAPLHAPADVTRGRGAAAPVAVGSPRPAPDGPRQERPPA